MKAWSVTEGASEGYYQDAFYTLMRLVSLQIIVILALAAGLGWYIKTSRNEDSYFVETIEGQRMQVVGLDRPYFTKEARANWAASAATEVMTFGFNDINERFSSSQRHFTQDGWDRFFKALTAGALIKNVTELQQIVTSVPQAPPTLVYEGLVNGEYSWIYDMPLMVTYRAGSAKKNVSKTVRMTVKEVPTSDNPIGLGISEWYIY